MGYNSRESKLGNMSINKRPKTNLLPKDRDYLQIGCMKHFVSSRNTITSLAILETRRKLSEYNVPKY